MGDLETDRHTQRISSHGVRSHQFSTGSFCHLSAGMVSAALKGFDLSGVSVYSAILILPTPHAQIILTATENRKGAAELWEYLLAVAL